MKATVVVNAAQNYQGALARELPMDKISESKTNPRSRFDEKAISELAANIEQHGVLQPIVVRPRPNGTGEGYEIVVGSRRFRAAKLARRATIPATVRELSDTEAAELQLVENLLREDVHELDEAQGYAALQRLDPASYTVETIALKVSRSPAYVSARLQLLKLVDEAKDAFRAGKLTVAHAFEIARLQPSDQQKALAECFPAHPSAAAVLKDRRAEAASVRELRAWVEREVHLDLSSAPFDPQDAALVPSAGACAKCPKRTGNNPLLFPESSLKKSTCIDRQCFRAKVDALVRMRASSVEKQGQTVVRVSEAPAWQPNRPANVLHEGQFHRAAGAEECPTTKPAVLIDGRNAGTLFHICQNDRCPVHAAATRYQPSPEERERRTREALAERIEKQTRLRVFSAVRSKLSSSLARPDLEMVARDYFLRLGHDNQRRICRVLGWEEKKTKRKYGSATVDYPSIAEGAIQKMALADLHRFLIVCALASDLCIPVYGAARGMAKDCNLARTAARCRIDIGKIAAEVRSELTNKNPDKTRAKRQKAPASRPPKTPASERGKQG